MPLYDPSVTIPIYAAFLAIAILLTLARLSVRIFLLRPTNARPRFGWDDIFVVLGLLIVSACAGIQFYNARRGNGGKATSTTTKTHAAVVEYKIDFVMLVIEKPAFGAIKLSLLCFYARLFGHWPSFQRYNVCLMVLIGVWALAFMLADVFLCGTHPEYHWIVNQLPNRARCGDKGMLLILFGVTSVVTDVLVVGLPLPYMQRLQLRWSKKAAASVVFLLGGVSTLAGILRTIFLCVAYPRGRLTWGYISPPEAKLPLVLKIINPTFWAMVEMLLGLWAANLPALAPLVRCASKHYHASSLYRKFSHSGASEREGSEKGDSRACSVVHARPLNYWKFGRKDSGAVSEQHPLV